jgi:hypothetical protein
MPEGPEETVHSRVGGGGDLRDGARATEETDSGDLA